MMMFLLRIIRAFLLLILTAVVSAEESQLSAPWETLIVESPSTSAAAATTGASASSVDVFVYCYNNATNKTTPYCSFIYVESPSSETNINKNMPSIDIKVEDSFDAPTPPSEVPTNNADNDKNFPSSFSYPTFDAPHAEPTKSPSASPAESI